MQLRFQKTGFCGMDVLAFIGCFHCRFGWILISIILFLKSSVMTERAKSINSHNANSKSQIPWNMLLDPNYTSHNKKTSPLNHTYQSPFHHNAPSMNTLASHPHHSYKKIPESFESPKPSQFSYQYVPHMNKVFSASEAIPQRNEYKPYNNLYVNQPMEKVMFPSNPSYQAKRPEVQQMQTSRPLQKNKATESNTKRGEVKKHKKRKPVDYFEAEDDDYMDSLYHDYDYPSPTERPSYSPPRKPPHYSKHKGDPLGLLPSASDPNGFFSKAKDLLKGASYGRPSYSASSPDDYYSQYPPNKNYGEPEHSYYNEDGYGNSDYPPKPNYYGSPGFDYEVPIESSHYGGVYPDKRKGTKYGPLAFALGLLPLGLLLASLVPTVVTIPVTTAVATGRRRKRSIEFVNPAIDIISSYGVSALEDPVCLNRIFCEVVRDGKQDTSSVVQKFYYKLAYILDEKIADFIGVKSLIMAVRKNKCQDFVCSSHQKISTSATNSTSKKTS